MRHCRTLGIAFVLALATITSGQTANVGAVKWQEGPSMGDLGGVAEIDVPAGYVFAGAQDTRLLMEAMENPTSGTEMGFVAPASKDWFVVFEFDAVGYVRDDEKTSLDAAAMLKSIRQGNEAANQERRRRGWTTMSILGWEQEPRYSEQTHNLEWAIRGESEGHIVVNHNTRLLGREGVMRVTLVADPTSLASILPEYRNVLSGYRFSAGHGYGEFRSGDKIAQYGLTALVAGGAAAVAVKTGMFKWIWKGLVIGALAVTGFVKRLFARKKPEPVRP